MNRVVNIVKGTKSLKKESDSLAKIKNKLREENKIVRREYESRIINKNKVNKKEMQLKVKMLVSKKTKHSSI